jgi:chromosomal replication initiator protein
VVGFNINSCGYFSNIHTITLEMVENFISPNLSTNTTINTSAITPRHIISVCAKHFNLKTSELCGSSRQKDLVTARHITAHLLLETGIPLKEVGHLLGGRDHTSIMHARDKVISDLSTNPQLRSVINQIKTSF